MAAISGKTRLAGVLGWPIEHSASPALHNAAYRAAGIDAVYVSLAVAPPVLADALRGVAALAFLGVNVTVPHKEAVVPYCAELDPTAARAGAVNTIVIRAGRLVGHNTDVGGLSDALRETDPTLAAAGGRAVVLGAGGAARAVVLALGGLGFACAVVARDRGRAEALLPLGAVEAHPFTAQALAALLPEARVLVDATSTGLDERAEQTLPTAVPLGALPAGALVASLVYHREPRLLAQARARGLPVMDGRGMLVHQAARAFTLMTGAPAPLEAMRAAL